MGVPSLVRRPRGHARRRLLLPGALALVLATALVWQSSYAGFGDSTPVFTASVGAGTVKLTNSVSIVGSSVSLDEVLPGETASYCIAVRSTGSAPAEVRLYGAGLSSTKDFAKHMELSWVAGTGGGVYGDCAGFVPNTAAATWNLGTFPTTWAGGLLPWTLTGNSAGEKRTYQLTYTVNPTAPATTKGGTLTVRFVWEAQTR
ncbi:MAG TPA: hypothetical protein VGO95_11850 [Modestobacter sp.]|jgi:hypothetical protein|nr:hypothetical protein [Modestobacter sp.]